MRSDPDGDECAVFFMLADFGRSYFATDMSTTRSVLAKDNFGTKDCGIVVASLQLECKLTVKKERQSATEGIHTRKTPCYTSAKPSICGLWAVFGVRWRCGWSKDGVAWSGSARLAKRR
jgi:hypothetical protein